MKTQVLTFLFLISTSSLFAQAWWETVEKNEQERSGGILLKRMEVQIEATEALNAMYGYNFPEAQREFGYLRAKYPEHPLPYFLFGLAEWWKIVPNTDNTMYDAKCEAFMDQAIEKAEKMFAHGGPEEVEASFFLATAYAFKSRLYAERKKWFKASGAGKSALKYFEKCKGHEDFSPEMAFGEGLYNYYRQWIPENYSALKPIFWFFHDGDKSKGIGQLEWISRNAFYTRTEAQYFLLQIYSTEQQHEKCYQLARYLHITYPWNPYFHRMYARQCFVTGRTKEAEAAAKLILERYDNKQFGYEPVGARYASYILAYYNHFFYHNFALAKEYYTKTVLFAEINGAKDSGYNLSSLLNLGKITEHEGNLDEAKQYYDKVMDYAERKSSQYQEAKKLLAENRKKAKAKKKGK
ncbi:MAG: tetratricopeptide repeat protein [Siphonobacter sp.]